MASQLGIDLRPLITPGGARGAGEVTKRVTQGLLDQAPDDVEIVLITASRPDAVIDVPTLFSWPSERVVRAVDIRDLQPSDVDLVLCYAHLPEPPRGFPVILVEHDLIILRFWDRFAAYVLDAILPGIMAAVVRPWLRLQWFRRLLKNLYRRYLLAKVDKARLIITDSRASREDLITLLGLPADKIVTIYLGVSQPQPGNDPEDEPDIADGPEKPFIFFMGAPDPKRELIELVEAFEQLRTQGRDVQLVFAGSQFTSLESLGDPILAQRIASSPHRDDILLLGFVTDDQKTRLYRQAAAMVYPSIYEGFGLPVLEAMALRCPIVYYNNSSMKEINEGFGFAVESAAEVAPMILHIMDLDSQQRTELLDAAQQHAATLTWEKTVSAYLDVIRGELNRS